MRRFLLLLLPVLLLSACQSEEGRLHNGYYSATSSSFDHGGWKEFITLCILNNRIITVEFNARNKSGLVLSWDVATLRALKKRTGTHPNEIIREYVQELLAGQSPSKVRRISGDTVFHSTFTALAQAALEQARSADRSVVSVTLPQDPASQTGPAAGVTP